MMHIACNIDSNYVKYCIVMLLSAFENNERGSIDVHIIADDLSNQDKSLIEDSLKRYGNRLHFYDVDDKMLADCPISPDSYISLSTYYRVFLPVILPAGVKKVIYLDCDLIVCSSLKPLWETDITDYALAAVEDMWSDFEPPYDRLGYDSKYSYFNAGVLYINLEYWRMHNVLEECVKYIQCYPDRLRLYDQDALNAVLYARRLRIPFTWNMQEGFYRRKRRIRKEVWAEIDSCLASPAILHYVGPAKPWHKACLHPLRKEWFVYLDQTKWKNERPSLTFKELFFRRINDLGIFLKLDKPRYRKVKKK